MLANFFRRFAANLVGDSHARVIQQLANVQVVRRQDNFKKGALVDFEEFGVPFWNFLCLFRVGSIGLFFLS
jgi:hypothetical protein